MTTSRVARVRYTAGPASFDARSLALELLEQGFKTTQIRNKVREAGFKIRNQTITDILKESRIITDNRDKLRHLSHGSPRTMVSPTVTPFTTRYMYHGEAILQIVRGGVILEWEKNNDMEGREIQFGSDELLSAERIRERFFDIIQKGFNVPVYYAPFEEDSLEDWLFEFSYFVILRSLKILSILES